MVHSVFWERPWSIVSFIVSKNYNLLFTPLVTVHPNSGTSVSTKEYENNPTKMIEKNDWKKSLQCQSNIDAVNNLTEEEMRTEQIKSTIPAVFAI